MGTAKFAKTRGKEQGSALAVMTFHSRKFALIRGSIHGFSAEPPGPADDKTIIPLTGS